METIKIKRIYEAPSPDDGYRMLVDRLWPRGVKKEAAALDEWNKTVPPSPELRKWFGHQPENFEVFRQHYRAELRAQKNELYRLLTIAQTQPLTLLYGAKDPHINHARVLLEVLLQLPPNKQPKTHRQQ